MNDSLSTTSGPSEADERAAVISEFNRTFGWSLPLNSDRETLETMSDYAALRGRIDIAKRIDAVLPKIV